MNTRSLLAGSARLPWLNRHQARHGWCGGGADGLRQTNAGDGTQAARPLPSRLAHRRQLQIEAEIELLSVKRMLVLDGAFCTIAPRLPLKLRLLLSDGLDRTCGWLVLAAVQAAVLQVRSRPLNAVGNGPVPL